MGRLQTHPERRGQLLDEFEKAASVTPSTKLAVLFYIKKISTSRPCVLGMNVQPRGT